MQTRGQATVEEAPAVSDDGRTIRGLVCPYGQVDTYQTTFERGAFDAGLKRKLPALCWGHDSKKIIGKATGYDDQPDGLYMTFRLADPAAVPAAREAQSLLADNMVDGMSIGFTDAVSRHDPHRRGVVNFVKATIFEVSIVLRASVPGSRVLALRSAAGPSGPDRELEAAMASLDHHAQAVGRRGAVDSPTSREIHHQTPASTSSRPPMPQPPDPGDPWTNPARQREIGEAIGRAHARAERESRSTATTGMQRMGEVPAEELEPFTVTPPKPSLYQDQIRAWPPGVPMDLSRFRVAD